VGVKSVTTKNETTGIMNIFKQKLMKKLFFRKTHREAKTKMIRNHGRKE